MDEEHGGVFFSLLGTNRHIARVTSEQVARLERDEERERQRWREDTRVMSIIGFEREIDKGKRAPP